MWVKTSHFHNRLDYENKEGVRKNTTWEVFHIWRGIRLRENVCCPLHWSKHYATLQGMGYKLLSHTDLQAANSELYNHISRVMLIWIEKSWTNTLYLSRSWISTLTLTHAQHWDVVLDSRLNQNHLSLSLTLSLLLSLSLSILHCHWSPHY